MNYEASPFHKFRGWKFFALFVVTMAYTVWFTVFGPFGKLEALAPGMPLEARGFYTGAQAVETLSQLDDAGAQLKLFSLLCDVPYMILTTLLFEAMIAFGIRHMRLTRPIWSLLFVLPIVFLLMDFTEDSFIALTLVTGSKLLGTIAGFATAAKFFAFIAANLAAILMFLAGVWFWLFKRKKA